ncbi:Hypothetical predicted protein [Paramuricea clavata]|uniref:Uncharacterized protein n=1 Tax=Paramuricea clavata TaxID=317549 RepID=A0A7D9HDR9_PARCT|nr:Hypothetical predicted protein [Paramuricea clavata]
MPETNQEKNDAQSVEKQEPPPLQPQEGEQEQDGVSEHSEKEYEEFEEFDDADYDYYGGADGVDPEEDFKDNNDDNVCDNNNDFDYLDDDEDEAGNADDKIYRTFMQQLIEARQKSAQKQRDSRFIPATRRYLHAPFVQREKSLNKTLIRNLMYLVKNIVSGDIGINVADIDKDLMRELLHKNTSKDEIRLHLIEDRRLHIYFRRALNVIEETKKNGGQREKTNDVRPREVQQSSEDVRSSYPTAKHSDRCHPYTRRSGTGRKSRGYDESGKN